MLKEVSLIDIWDIVNHFVLLYATIIWVQKENSCKFSVDNETDNPNFYKGLLKVIQLFVF